MLVQNNVKVQILMSVGAKPPTQMDLALRCYLWAENLPE